MKIIFLDFDGVLNFNPVDPEVIKKASSEDLSGYNKELVKNLVTVLDETEAKIVISSSWRLYKDHPMYPDWRKTFLELVNRGNDIIVGETKDMYEWAHFSDLRRHRGKEIWTWLQDHPSMNIEKWLVLDDEVYDMDPIMDHVIHIDERRGLDLEYVKQACDYLGRINEGTN